MWTALFVFLDLLFDAFAVALDVAEFDFVALTFAAMDLAALEFSALDLDVSMIADLDFALENLTVSEFVFIFDVFSLLDSLLSGLSSVLCETNEPLKEPANASAKNDCASLVLVSFFFVLCE